MSKEYYIPYSETIAASGTKEISYVGKFFCMLGNTGASDIYVQIGDDAERQIPAGIGIELPSGETFNRIRFRNSEASPVTITFAISSGRIFDNRFVVSGVINTNDSVLRTALGNSSTFITAQVSVTNVSAAAIAANSARKRVTIKVPSSGQTVYIKNAAVTTANGHLLEAGDAITLNTTEAIYAIVASGTQTISYLEE